MDKIARKQALQEHWSMMKWLVDYTRKNQYHWEKRREVEMMSRKEEEEWKEWVTSDRDMQMMIVKEEKGAEMIKEDARRMRIRGYQKT